MQLSDSRRRLPTRARRRTPWRRPRAHASAISPGARLPLLLAWILLVPALWADQLPRPFEFSQVHMGLPVRILLHASDASRAERAARAAFDRIAALDLVMSDYKPDSELRRLEEQAGRWTPVSPYLLEVLATAVAVARDTGGAFDPTVGPLVALWRESRRTGRLPAPAALAPARALVNWQLLQINRSAGSVRLAKAGMRLDLGGVAKGYILQHALGTLRANGIGRALIESGGDIVAGSGPPGLAGWRVEAAGADAIFRRRASALVNAALATSGATAQFVEIEGVRYSHIVDPRTGLGVTNQVLARVIARDGAVADALATALTVVGLDGARAIQDKYADVLISLTTSAR